MDMGVSESRKSEKDSVNEERKISKLKGDGLPNFKKKSQQLQ
jgi:hypothetical protein